MNHIDNQTLYRLAAQAVRGKDPDPKDAGALAHIRDCESCYRRFAVMATMMDRLGADGVAQTATARLLAAVRLTITGTGDRLRAVFGQVSGAAADIAFVIPRAPAPGTARGTSATPKIIRVDGTATEEDLISYDTERHVLTVQLSLEEHPGLRAHAEIHLRDGRCLSLPLAEEDGVLYGRMEEFSEPDAEIRLVEDCAGQ